MKQLFCILMLAGAVLISAPAASVAGSLTAASGTGALSPEENPKPKKKKYKKAKKARKKNKFGQKKAGAKKKAQANTFAVPMYALK
jgi:hypothetical protein